MAIDEIFKPPDWLIPMKSTWWLTLAKENLDSRLHVIENLGTTHYLGYDRVNLHRRLQASLLLINRELLDRMRLNLEELPTLKNIPKAGYHGDVRASGVR